MSQNSSSTCLIFICGIMGRAGTNFLARLILAHPDVCRPQGHWELPLFIAVDEFVNFHDAFLKTRRPERLDYSLDEFCHAFGRGFLDTIAERVVPPLKPYLLHKHPGTKGIEHFSKFFPDAKLIFLVRDGRDNVNSLISAAGFSRKSWWNIRRVKYFYHYSQQWAESANRILNYHETQPDILVVRFEELHKDPRKVLQAISLYTGLFAEPKWLDNAPALPVLGSSFYHKSKGSISERSGGSHWQEVLKGEEFQPIGRWRRYWSKVDLLLFKQIAGGALQDLGYEV